MPLKFALRVGLLFFITLAPLLKVHAADTPPTIAQAAAALPNPVTANATTLSVLGADDGGEANLIYTWTAVGTPPSAPVFSMNSTNGAKVTQVTVSKAGTYKFTVTIQDGAGQTITSPQLTVTVSKVLTSIVVTPVNSAIDPGTTKDFAASAKDQFGNAMTATLAWAVSGGGAIDTAGLFTSDGTAGSFTVSASSGTVTGNTTIRVNAAPTVATPASGPAPVTTKVAALSVLGADDVGEAALKYSWAVTGAPPAPVTFNRNNSNAAKNVNATFTTDGSYDFQVTITDARGLSVTSSVTLQVVRSLATIAIVPGAATVNLNASRQFTATGKDQFGTLLATQPTFTWSLTGAGSVDSSGLYTAPAAPGGPYVLTATSGSISDTSQITVANAAPTIAQAINYAPKPLKDTEATLTVLGADDGGEANLTYTWAVTGFPPAPVVLGLNGTNASKEIDAQFTKAGSYDFQVTITDSYGLTKVATKTIAVIQAVTSITVSPSNATVNPSGTQQFTAQAFDQFNHPFVTAPTFTWTKSGGGTITNTGLFTAGTTVGGPFTITAKNSGISGTATVSIAANTAPTVAVAASAAPSPVTGTTTQLSVLGADDTGEDKLTYTWSATGPGTVTFSSNGTNAAKNTQATFTQSGTYNLTATIQDQPGLSVASFVSVNVVPALHALQLDPTTATVEVGGTQKFTPSGLDQFGLPLLELPTMSWSASGGGTVDQTGNFTATSVGGPFGVTATYNFEVANAAVTVRDSIVPLIGGLTPENGTTTGTAQPLFSATFSDVGTGVNPASIVLALDGAEITSLAAVSSGGFTYTPASPLTPGAHYFTVTLQDFAGNPALAATSFTIPTPTSNGVTITAPATANPNPVQYNTTELTVGANDPAGEQYLVYRWELIGQNPAPVTFTRNDSNAAKNTSAAFAKPGIYHFKVTVTNIENEIGTSFIDVTVLSTAVGVNITPHFAYVDPSQTQQFSAQIIDQFGAPTPNQPESFTWTADSWNGDSTIDATGLFTAGDQTPHYNIQASSGEFSGYAYAAWNSAPEGYYYVDPSSVQAKPGDQVKIRAFVFGYDYFLYEDVPTTWTIDGGGVIDGQGVVTLDANANGWYYVTGTNANGVSATAGILVSSPPIVAQPASAQPAIVRGTQATVSVLGDDLNGEANLSYYWQVVESPPAWVDFDLNFSNDAKSNIAHFSQPGTYTLECTISNQNGLSTTSRVNVRVIPVPTYLAATALDTKVAAGTAALVQAQPSDQFHAPMNIPVLWSVDTGGSIDQNGVFTADASATGNATVTASVGALNATILMQIVPGGGSTGNFKIASGLTGDKSGEENGKTVYYTNGYAVQVLYTQSLANGPVGDVVFSATSDVGDSIAVTIPALNVVNGTALGNLTLSAEGKYTLTVSINDQISAESLTLYVDRTKPELSIALPLRPSPINPSIPDPVYLNGYMSAQNQNIRSKLGLNIVGADELLVARYYDPTGLSSSSTTFIRSSTGQNYPANFQLDPQTSQFTISTDAVLPESKTFNLLYTNNPAQSVTGVTGATEQFVCSYQLKAELKDKAGNSTSQNTIYTFQAKRTPPKAYGGSGYGTAWFMGTTRDCIQAWTGTPAPDTRATNTKWDLGDQADIGHSTFSAFSGWVTEWALAKPGQTSKQISTGTLGATAVTVQDYAGNLGEQTIYFPYGKVQHPYTIIKYINDGQGGYWIDWTDSGGGSDWTPNLTYPFIHYYDDDNPGVFAFTLDHFSYKDAVFTKTYSEDFSVMAPKDTFYYDWFMQAPEPEAGYSSHLLRVYDPLDNYLRFFAGFEGDPHPRNVWAYNFTSNPIENGKSGQEFTPRIVNLPITSQQNNDVIDIKFTSPRNKQHYDAMKSVYGPNFNVGNAIKIAGWRNREGSAFPSIINGTVTDLDTTSSTQRSYFVNTGPGLISVADNLGGSGLFYLNAVSTEKKVVNTGSVVTFTVDAGFLDKTLSFTNFDPNGNYFHILTQGGTDLITNTTLGVNGVPVPYDETKITILRDANGNLLQSLLPVVGKELDATRLQRLSVTAYVGNQVPTGRHDYEIKLGRVVGFDGTLDGGNKGPHAGHLIKKALDLYAVKFMAVNKTTGQIEDFQNTTVTTSSPTISLTKKNVKVLGNTPESGVSVQLELSGAVHSEICDATPGDNGVIQKLMLYRSNKDVAVTTVDLAVSKRSTGDMPRPYAYDGSFNTTLTLNELSIGANSFTLEVVDPVQNHRGVHELIIEVGPRRGLDPNPNDPNSGGFGHFNQPYSVHLDMTNIQALTDLDNNASVGVTITSNVSRTAPVITETLVKTGSSPLILSSESVTLTIDDSELSNLTNSLGTEASSGFNAKVYVPRFSFKERNLAFVESTTQTSQFDSKYYPVELTFVSGTPGISPNQLQVKVRTVEGTWEEQTLVEDAQSPNIYKNLDSSVVVDATDAPAESGGLTVKVTDNSKGLSAQPVDVKANEPGSQTYKSENIDIAYSEPNDDEESTEVPPVNAAPPDTGKVTAKNDFANLVIRVEATEEQLNSPDFKVQSLDGPRPIKKGVDGNYYVADKSGSRVDVLILQPRQSSVPPPAIVQIQRDPYEQVELKFLGGFIVGIGKGGWALAGDTVEFAWGAVNWVTSFGTDKVILQWDMIFNPEIAKATQEHNQAKLNATLEAIEDAAKVAIQIQNAVGERQNEIIEALITGDVEKLKLVSEEHREAFELCVELLDEIREEVARMPAYEQGQLFGRIVFEVVSIIAPYAKPGQLSKITKVEALQQLVARLRTYNEFKNPRLAQALERVVKYAQELATTKMCFIAGTPVLTLNGSKAIQDVKVGDWVLSRSEKTFDVQYKKVLATFVTHPSTLYEIQYRVLDSSTRANITSTGEHPFWLVNKRKFVPVNLVHVGDAFSTNENKTTIVERIILREAKPGETFTTYNFEVDEFHTYFAGTIPVWVHNSGRECERFFALYQRFRSRGVGAWESFVKCLFRVPDAHGGTLIPAAKEAMREAYQVGATGESIAGVPSVRAINAAMTGRKGYIPGARTIFSADGEIIDDVTICVGTELQTHHVLPKYLRKMLQRAGYDLGEADDVPGLLITAEDHLGPQGIHSFLDAAGIPARRGIADYSKNQILDGLRDGYLKAGKGDVWKVLEKWLAGKGVAR